MSAVFNPFQISYLLHEQTAPNKTGKLQSQYKVVVFWRKIQQEDNKLDESKLTKHHTTVNNSERKPSFTTVWPKSYILPTKLIQKDAHRFSVGTIRTPVSACKFNSTALLIQTVTKKQGFQYKVKYPQDLHRWRNPWELLGSETDFRLRNTSASLFYRLIEISPLPPTLQINRNSAALGFPAPCQVWNQKRD